MRREDPKTLVNSFLLGLVIALIAAAVLRPLYEKEQEERKLIEAEWVQEQIRADRAYQAEVEAERKRWEEIEEEERLASITENATEAAEVIFDDPQIPDEIEEACRKWGEIYQIAPEFLESIAWQESRFDNEAKNGSCTGLMQISIPRHRDRIERLGYTEADMWDIEPNIAVAADYLAELFAELNDDYYVLMRYNGDSSAEAFLNGTGEPSSYATEICTRAAVMTNYHEKGGAAWDNTN